MRPFRRVLIVEPYGIGDLLFLTPVLRALRLVPTVEKVDLILGSRTEAVVRSNPHVDEIFSIDKDLFHRRSRLQNFQEVRRLTKVLKKNRYDLMLDYSQRPEYGFWARFFLGIAVRAGFDYARRGTFLTHRVPLPEGFWGRHVVDFYCEVAQKAGIPVDDRDLEFYVQDEERDAAQVCLEAQGFAVPRYAVVAPGGGESWGKDAHFKRWPVRFFAQLIQKLKSRLAIPGVVILGSTGERELAGELASRIDLPSVNLAGDCSLNLTAALIERSSLFIGNDGGLVHLARALQIPVIAFYGPVPPEVYGPYPPSPEAVAIFKQDLECRPCYRKFRYKSDCEHRNCLQALEPEEAFAQIQNSGFLNELKWHETVS